MSSLEAINDEQVPVTVDVADVARVRPTVGIGTLAGGDLVVQVARHDLRTVDPNLTVLVDARVVPDSQGRRSESPYSGR